MALVTPSNPSPDVSTTELAPQITGLIAGEDLLAVAPCYIKTSDGKVYQSNGTALTEPAEFAGFTPRATKNGQPVTLFALGACFRYSNFSGQAGNRLYIAATPGRLDDAPTTGDPITNPPTAIIIDNERIRCCRIY
jgi:hypothetical protein